MTKKKAVKRNYTEMGVVMDESGSMAAVIEDAIGGFNTFLVDQKKVPGTAKLTLTKFNTEMINVCDGIDLKKAKAFDKDTYIPGGMTALYDAIGDTVKRIKERIAKMRKDRRPDNVVIVILTDGEENSSREFTREMVFKTIKAQEKKEKWTFVYLGVNQDSFAVGVNRAATVAGAAIGICPMGCTGATGPCGTSKAYKSASSYVVKTRSGVDKNAIGHI